jgi:organic radical activating enzyme
MLVEAWNERPELQEVYDVLISGGEPLLLNNKTIQEMLNLLRQAKHLHVLRFCTATVFQGLPFRIDNQLITLLKNFQKETGVTMAFNCHISHSEFFTPEAVVAVLKLREAGFDIMAQTPLEEGVNFWVNDLNKTIETLRLLDRCFFFIAGRRPYKWITDMQGSISLLSVIRVWQKLHDRHQLESNITKPTACELFLSLPTGNLALSYHSLWALKMQVDKKKKIVQYKIPHAAGNVIEYEEKLMSDINDDPKVLDNLKKFQ